jgi:hypothetical protein
MKLPKHTLNIALGVIAIGTIGYIVYRRINASIIKTKLIDALNKRTGESGGVDDLGSQGGALDPAYYESVKNVSSLLSEAVANSYADDLKKAIGNKYMPLSSDESKAIGIITKLKNKAQVSQVASAYQKKNKSNMLDDMKSMDFTVFGVPNLNPVMPRIQKIIDALPSK